jgi:hypothetical protein
LHTSVPWVISFKPSVATMWSMSSFSSAMIFRSIPYLKLLSNMASSAGVSVLSAALAYILCRFTASPKAITAIA